MRKRRECEQESGLSKERMKKERKNCMAILEMMEKILEEQSSWREMRWKWKMAQRYLSVVLRSKNRVKLPSRKRPE